jgi:protein-disulfide isomerase
MPAKNRIWLGLPALIAIVAIVAVLASGLNNSGNIIGGDTPEKTQLPSTPRTGGVAPAEDPYLGSMDADVEIVVFSDFQCPFCARAVPIIKQIEQEYGDMVKIVFRDFPLSFHQNAQKAAEAAECADDQGSFWEYHDRLFENQNSLDVNSLIGYAGDLGLDSEQFEACLNSGTHAQEVLEDFQDGRALGVTGTPTFFINGIKLVGAKPFAEFKAIIDSELGGEA